MPDILSRLVDVYVFRRGPAGVEFLQLHRRPGASIGGTWQSVHGGIEPGESATQAARRELREETGIDPLRLWQLEHVNTFFIAADDAIHLCPGFAAEVTADATVQIDDEHDAFRWVGAAQAVSSFLWPGQRTSVREILDTIVMPGEVERFMRL